MLDALIALQMQELSIRTVGGVRQHQGDAVHAHTYIRAPYGIYPTSDGYLSLAFADLGVLAELLATPELAQWDAEKDGFTHREEISTLVATGLARNTTAHWLAVLGERGLWVGPVNSYEDVLDDPQVQHNGSFVTYDHPTEGTVTTPGFAFRMSRTPAAVDRPAPTAGQHTVEVLTDLGLDRARIEALLSADVVRS
jgi:crotonobetainyl-CoA:carnitine CoA-transferase CaiB-like acyl-CoA transferase